MGNAVSGFRGESLHMRESPWPQQGEQRDVWSCWELEEERWINYCSEKSIKPEEVHSKHGWGGVKLPQKTLSSGNSMRRRENKKAQERGSLIWLCEKACPLLCRRGAASRGSKGRSRKSIFTSVSPSSVFFWDWKAFKVVVGSLPRAPAAAAGNSLLLRIYRTDAPHHLRGETDCQPLQACFVETPLITLKNAATYISHRLLWRLIEQVFNLTT